MICILVFRSLPGSTDYEVLAEAKVENSQLQTKGRRQDLIDTSREVFSARLERFLTYDEDDEEWLRSFAETFMTAQVGAIIIADSDHPELVASSKVLDEVQQDAFVG